MNIIDEIEQEQMKEIREKRDVPEFNAGDTMKVHLKVVEGTRERIQIFEGLCIAIHNPSKICILSLVPSTTFKCTFIVSPALNSGTSLFSRISFICSCSISSIIFIFLSSL